MGYHLATNNKPYPLFYKAELPEKARADFDYVDDDDYSNRFVKYRGVWHDVHDSQAIRRRDCNNDLPIGWSYPVWSGEPLERFDCIITDSYFSAVAFRFVGRNGDSVVCATIIS